MQASRLGIPRPRSASANPVIFTPSQSSGNNSANTALRCERGSSPLLGVSIFQSENGDGKQEAEVAGALAYLGPESLVLTQGGRGFTSLSIVSDILMEKS